MTGADHPEVVITRPLAQARTWRDRLQKLGFAVHLLPVLEIVAVSEPDQVQAVKDRILALADYHKVIFVSQNAVQQAMDWFDRYWPQLPVGVQYFAVGSATAAAAARWGLEVQAAGQAMNSEALLALPALQRVQNEKVLICRGLGGRNYLAEELEARGARVDFCELYRRELPAAAAADLRRLTKSWAAAGKSPPTAVVAVHSGDSLQNLNQLIEDIAWPEVKNCVLLVPGARVAELARQWGFSRIIVAENATDDAMTRALVESR